MTEPLTAAEIEADLALCEKATEGPWELTDVPNGGGGRLNRVLGPVTPFGPRDEPGRVIIAEDNGYFDAAFIAAARTGWPRALAELKEARRCEHVRAGCMDMMRGLVDGMSDGIEALAERATKAEARADRAEAALKQAMESGGLALAHCVLQSERAEKAEAALAKALDDQEYARAHEREDHLYMDELRAELAGYEQTTGDECPACGWRGIRGDDGCAFCLAAEAKAKGGERGL
jgi:hypothetical protein